MVIGVDTHKSSHAMAAVSADGGLLVGEREVAASEEGYLGAVGWARGLDRDRVWAIEDCRHVSRRLEQALLAAGETVVRVPPKMMGALVEAYRPLLLSECGVGPLTAARLIGRTAGAERFPSDAHFASQAGVAPVPVFSGRRDRHRLHGGGDRQLNRALHTIAITRARVDPSTRAYLERKRAEGKTNKEAVRCLKRHLARRVHRLLATPPVHHDRGTRIQLNAPISVPCLT